MYIPRSWLGLNGVRLCPCCCVVPVTSAKAGRNCVHATATSNYKKETQMPWWGWLIVAVIALGALYLVAWAVFARTVFKQVKSVHENVFEKDPFDAPFFRNNRLR